MTREEALQKAQQIICHDRNNQYGEPEDSFPTVAEMWTAYLCGKYKASGKLFVTGEDVAIMMAMLKFARQTSCPKEDNLIDAIGYSACAAEIASK